MKLCGKCGAHNADDRMFCVDCDAKLGDPLPKEQEQHYTESLDDKLNTLYDKGAPLHVSLTDKIVGCADALGAAALIVTVIVRAFTRSLPEGWGAILLFGLFVFLFSAAEALLPQLGWKLATIRLWANGTEDLTPNGFYRVGRKIGIWFFLIMGLSICVMLIRGEAMVSS